MRQGRAWAIRFHLVGFLLLVGAALTLLTFLPTFSQEPEESESQTPWTGELAGGQRITQADLDKILQAHALWVNSEGKQGHKANLRNTILIGGNLERANLKKINLNYAILRWAKLREVDLQGSELGADLMGADLSKANLREANMSGADLREADMSRANLQKANLKEASIQYANLSMAQLSGANLSGSFLQNANLHGAILSVADLNRANLTESNLNGANLSGSNLSGADLSAADLSGADLSEANLSGADLLDACLRWANIERAKGIKKAQMQKARAWVLAYYDKKLCTELGLPQDHNQKVKEKNFSNYNLTGVNLQSSDLGGFNFSNANLTGTNISWTNLSKVIFEPKPGSLSDVSFLIGIQGLSSITFINSPHALVELREAYKKAGMRNEEREVTFSLNHTRREYLWKKGGFLKRIESLFQLIFFEWTCQYGMSPGRPLKILGVVLLILTLPYMLALRCRNRETGIWLVLMPNRVLGRATKDRPYKLTTRTPFRPLPEKMVAKLMAKAWGALRVLRLGFYFSLLSAFSLGWRELNVGNWITRIQKREYTLRATGWVRTVAGLQSLLSVYMLALWVLTYFGRPFD